MNRYFFRKFFLGAYATVAMTTIHAAAAVEIRLVCPAELPDNALRTGTSVDGWRPYKSRPLLLHSAAPTGGPPEEQADLASFTTVTTKTARIDTYDLAPPHPGGIWIKCGYGALNEITLHQQLDDRIRQCRITTSKAAPPVIDILCK